jgi:hypothetical protein
MKTISKEYIILFNEMTEACEKLTNLSNELHQLSRQLMSAQIRTEELFLEDDDTDLSQTND